MSDHIFIHDIAESISFANPQGRGPGDHIPERNRQAHADRLIELLTAINAENIVMRNGRLDANLPTRQGVYLEFQSTANYDLIVKSLEDMRSNIRLLNVRVTENEEGNITHATIHIRPGKEGHFIRKINEYANHD